MQRDGAARERRVKTPQGGEAVGAQSRQHKHGDEVDGTEPHDVAQSRREHRSARREDVEPDDHDAVLEADRVGHVIRAERGAGMMTHAFDVWDVRRLDLKTDERNERSRRAIERIGGQFEGVLRNWQAAQVVGEEGLTRNSAIYSILPPEWPGVRARLATRLRDD